MNPQEITIVSFCIAGGVVFVIYMADVFLGGGDLNL